MHLRCLALSLLITAPLASRAEISITEIMYHPSSENPAEEYIELYNTGAATDISGWQFTSGVTFTVPAVTNIGAGAYLVVTANPAVFHAKYPAVVNYIAGSGWTGQLSNSANNVVLKNNFAVKVDEVDYSDDGDWGQRERDNPPSFGHRGWGWNSAADGGGKSLELINAVFDNNEGQNWLPSTTVQGTPGAANSVAAADLAPVVTQVEHLPPIPASTDPVTVTARVRDDNATALAVDLRYRNDGAGGFSTAQMFDDGAHGDGLAGDGVFGASLTARANGTIVEYYIRAADAATNTRYWPAKSLDYTGTSDHFCNCLYQVDDSVYAGAQPLYNIILKAADKTELNNINGNSGTPPFPYNPGEDTEQAFSHARFNGTFISRDGTGLKLRYLAGTRNRGNGSRSASPQSVNVQFPNADPWSGIHGLNFNTQHTPFQLFGSSLFRKAGLVMAESRAVQVHINATNSAGAGNPAYGFYVCNEALDSDFTDHHYPLDSSGNIYKAFRVDSSGGADLRDQSAGQPAATADPTPYRVNYFKDTNVSEDKWSDLINLTKILAKGHASAGYGVTWDADYQTQVEATVDVAQWLKFFAVNLLADNSETNIATGDGDDYFLYFGGTNPRAQLVSYDLDTLFHRQSGTTTPGTVNGHGIFRMCQVQAGSLPATPVFPLMIHPKFSRLYLAELKRLMDGPFSAAQFNPLADEILSPVWDSSSIQAVKAFNAGRVAYVASLMPLSISSVAAQTTVGVALTATSGYPVSTAATCKLIGKADCTRTASVKVSGLTGTYAPWQVTNAASFTTSIGDWSVNNIPLSPGLNRLRIQAFDSSNAEIEQSFFDVWYDDASVAGVSGAIAANTTWTAAGGPYQVTANLTVNSGVTLTIQPGTSVYLNSGITMTVAAGGRILAEGTAAAPIRFSRAPGLTTNGGTITINGQAGAPETHFYYTYFEFGGNPAVTCAANSNVILDHCEWLRNDTAFLHLDGGSFIVSNCIFPSSAAGAYFEGVHGANAAPPAGGRAIVRDSFFGKISSAPGGGDYNDVFDFTGGNRPGPILQFYNNVMIGSDDDLLDIDGTDMWCEGNIFMHVHRFGSPDSASAISGGNDGGGGTGSRRSATAIDTATGQVTCGTHGFTTGQEVAVTSSLGSVFPAATPALHNGGPFFTRAVSTTAVKLYLTAADANADTNAINFSGTIGAGISLSLCKLDAISHITIAGNLFYDLDQAATAKEGNFYTFLNNTVINQNNTGSQDAATGVLNFGDDGYHEAGGMYAEGNVIHSAASLVRNYPGAGLAQTVTWNNNLFPRGMTWSGAGSGNTSADALLNDTAIPTPGPYDYQRVAAQIRAKFGLQPGSPARGTGPNGSDKGGVRPLGVSIGGAPAGTTNATGATLSAGTRMSGSGIPAGTGAWASGSGWTHYKRRLDGGAWSAETVITTPITLTGLANGTHTVDVAGKNDAGTYQDSTDLGPDARLSSVTWTVDTSYIPPAPAANVRINEVLAKNTETQNFGTVFPDIIELHNAGTANAVLDGWGLTDNAALPYKYTIPAGTNLAAGSYLVIYASSSASVPAPKTGFALKDAGDTLTLTKSAAAGGTIADSVPFGAQLPDYSIGRRAGDAAWDLCRPTFGAANNPAAQATTTGVKINEWLADAAALAGQDFIELMNTATLPVNAGNCFLTDNPQDWPNRHALRQLTFIAPGGYVSFKADSDPGQGPDHLNFKLAAEQGEIGLFTPSLTLVDNIVYGPQSTDVSQGRTPNGTDAIALFTQPTPGGPNPGVTGTVITTTNLIPATQSWRYRSNGTDHSADFIPIAFNDSGWTNAPQLLYIETASLTNSEGFTKATALPVDAGNSNRPYNATYFRTHFTYAGPLTGVTLKATMMIDDGAVFYLNGVEILPTSGARLRMPAGTIAFATVATGNIGDATVETVDFPGTGLVAGDNVLCVAVHQEHSGTTQSSSDITFGLKLNAVTQTTGGAGALVLNEVLPINTALPNPGGSLAGWVEIYNSSAAAISLADASLSDDPATPRKFVFPAGASIAAGTYSVVFLNPLAAASATNTGWAINGDGGTVFLFNAPAAGGGLQDAVSYGRQIPNFAVGRTPAWALTVPTRGALNSAAGTSALTSVKLNEWITNPTAGADFLELYNTAAQPVALGGNYLTDDLSDRRKQLIPPLSYIGGTGAARWQSWTADNDAGGTPGHTNFTLDDYEALGLYTSTGVALDLQALDVSPAGQSRGRFADGTATISALTPTPGTANVEAVTDSDTDDDGIPDAWELAHGLNPNSAADATLDGEQDGANNLLEFAFNLNPQLSDIAASTATTGLPTAQLVTVPGGQSLEVTFLRRKPPGGSTLTYTAQFSNDLTAWSTGLAPTVTSVDAEWERIVVRDSAPAASGRRCVRVTVTTVQP